MQVAWINSSYVDEAMKILKSKHDSLVLTNRQIPNFSDFQNLVDDVNGLFSLGNGVVALSNGRLIGFLAGFPCKNFFGKNDGIYCPAYGIGMDNDVNRAQIIDIYSAASELWIANQQFTHAITILSNEDEIKDNLFWQGFGLRCVDAITSVKNISEQINNEIIITMSNSTMYEDAQEIHQLHNEYYRKPPIFMPNQAINYVEEQQHWNSQGNLEWLALRNNKIVGTIRLCKDGESYSSCHKNVMNIKGAYVLDSEQGSGVGKHLLGAVKRYLDDSGFSLCGVDFESINPKATRFWLKHFEPYTYSLVRRVDERIRCLTTVSS